MMMIYHNAWIVLATLSLHSYDSLAETSQCPCLFNDNDVADCLVYGALDGELKAWSKASQDCLDAYQIKVDAPDPALVCSSANSFVNALKNGALASSKVKFGLGIPYGGFWQQSTTNPDIPVLKDTITIDGDVFDCTQSESTCYNAMKPYFESDPDGIEEMKDVCQTLENQVRSAKETQQSVLRTRLCQEYRDDTSTTIASECTAMFDELQPEFDMYSNLNCGGFGVGPGNRQLPDCDTNEPGDDDSSTSSIESIVTKNAYLLGFVGLWLTCHLVEG